MSGRRVWSAGQRVAAEGPVSCRWGQTIGLSILESAGSLDEGYFGEWGVGQARLRRESRAGWGGRLWRFCWEGRDGKQPNE